MSVWRDGGAEVPLNREPNRFDHGDEMEDTLFCHGARGRQKDTTAIGGVAVVYTAASYGRAARRRGRGTLNQKLNRYDRGDGRENNLFGQGASAPQGHDNHRGSGGCAPATTAECGE